MCTFNIAGNHIKLDIGEQKTAQIATRLLRQRMEAKGKHGTRHADRIALADLIASCDSQVIHTIAAVPANDGTCTVTLSGRPPIILREEILLHLGRDLQKDEHKQNAAKHGISSDLMTAFAVGAEPCISHAEAFAAAKNTPVERADAMIAYRAIALNAPPPE